MPNIGDILKAGGKTVDLQDEFEALRAIEAIASRWSDISASLDRSISLPAFLKRLDDELDKEDVKTVLSEIGLDDELDQIKAARKKISDFFGKVGFAHPERLLAPLSANLEDTHTGNDGMVRWSLVDKEPNSVATATRESVDYDLQLGGDASIEVEGGALWPYSSDEVERRLVRMGVAGGLSAKGAFKVPFSLGTATGSAGGSVSAGASVDLDYYFDPADQSALLCSAIAKRILHVPNPFDLNAIVRAYNSNTDFYGFDLAKDGGVTADVQLSIGKGLDLKKIGKVAVEIQLKATLIRQRKFQISLRRLPGGNPTHPKMRLVVSGKKKSEDSRSVGIQVVLEFDKLAEHVHGKLGPIVNKWDASLKKIKPYLTPGTYLQNEAGELVGDVVKNLIADTEIASAIASDIGLLLGTSEAKDIKIGDYLGKEIESTLNGLVSSVLDDAEAQAEEVLKGLKARLPIFKTLDKDDLAVAELKKLTEKANSEFTQKLNEIVSTETERKKIAKALGKIGREVDGVVEDADKAFAKVRELVAEFDRIVKDALKELANSANHKAQLSFAYSKLESDKSSFELKANFSAQTDPDDYRTLLSGHFADTKKLIMDQAEAGSAATIIFEEGTNIKRAVEHQNRYGGEFIAFGLKSEFSTLFSGQASIEVDHRGNVEVTSQGVAKDTSRTLFSDETTEASFLDVLTLARAREAAVGNAMPSIDLGLNLRRSDPAGMKQRELNKLLKDMQEFSLLSSEGAKRATAAVESWLRSGNKRKVPVTIDVALPLNSQQVLNVMNRGNADNATLDQRQAETLSIAVNAIYDTLNPDDTVHRRHWRVERDYTWGRDIAKDWLGDQGSDARLMLALAKRGTIAGSQGSHPGIGSQDASRRIDAFEKLFERVKDSWKLVEMTQDLHRVYHALPGDAGTSQPWDIHRYAAEQRSIAGHTEGWLATGQWAIFAGTDGIDERMAAFFLALGGLAGLSYDQVRSAVTLTIKHSKQGGEQVVVQ